MRTFIAKVVVKLKPNLADTRGQMLKSAIEKVFEISNLTCRVGTSYSLQFCANNQVEALNLIEKISKELLVNEVTEFYEIRSLVEAEDCLNS